jgi:hypothetical protein
VVWLDRLGPEQIAADEGDHVRRPTLAAAQIDEETVCAFGQRQRRIHRRRGDDRRPEQLDLDVSQVSLESFHFADAARVAGRLPGGLRVLGFVIGGFVSGA